MDRPARIAGLRLDAAMPLEELRAFYGDVLELPVLRHDAGELAVQAGGTEITFVSSPDPVPAPRYHLAFNIPENRILEARQWQRQRTALLTPGDDEYAALRDPSMPADVVSFSHWNAHSVFFWDPAGNLLEHVARHELDNATDAPFGGSAIECVSEIALVVDDVPATAALLAGGLRLSPYREISSAFAALGDPRGLLLVFRRGRNLGFDDGVPAAVHPIEVTLRGGVRRAVEVPGYPYRVRPA